MPPNILTPAAMLVVWTMAMLLWMAATRLPALRKLNASKVKLGARGDDLEGMIDDRIQWKAHNYTHLMEQPTVFYAAVFILVLGGYTVLDVILAWLYVGLRVAHSLWQATINRQPGRIVLFVLSSLALIPLALRALVTVL
jgi:hypothetical protein